MEVTKKELIEITLQLTKEEAEWLKGVMQNPISHRTHPGSESEESENIRERFWFTLDKAGVKL